MSHLAAALGMTDYGESEIFDPDWFGDASPDNSLHTVDDGRWAYLPVMKASTLKMDQYGCNEAGNRNRDATQWLPSTFVVP